VLFVYFHIFVFLSGPVILFQNKVPFVIGVINSVHLRCQVPDLHTRVSSILDWIKLNTIDGVCISNESFDEALFYPCLHANFIFIVLCIAANLIINKLKLAPKVVTATYYLFFVAGFLLPIVFIVE